MDFAQGKILLSLEGGYNLQSLADSAHACVQVLLDEKPIIGSSEAYPFESTWRVIENVSFSTLTLMAYFLSLHCYKKCIVINHRFGKS